MGRVSRSKDDYEPYLHSCNGAPTDIYRIWRCGQGSWRLLAATKAREAKSRGHRLRRGNLCCPRPAHKSLCDPFARTSPAEELSECGSGQAIRRDRDEERERGGPVAPRCVGSELTRGALRANTKASRSSSPSSSSGAAKPSVRRPCRRLGSRTRRTGGGVPTLTRVALHARRFDTSRRALEPAPLGAANVLAAQC